MARVSLELLMDVNVVAMVKKSRKSGMFHAFQNEQQIQEQL